MRKILADQRVIARDQNKVFVESAGARRLSAVDAKEKYGMDRGKGAAYIEFDIEPELLRHRDNPRMQCEESFIVGDVDLRQRNPEAFFNF